MSRKKTEESWASFPCPVRHSGLCFKQNLFQPGCRKYPRYEKSHIGRMSVYIQSGAVSLPAGKMMLIHSLHSCGSPAGAMSQPIFAGKKKQTDRPNCDFGRVRRFNPSALCRNVNNCLNLECSRVESVSAFLLIRFFNGLLNLKTSELGVW